MGSERREWRSIKHLLAPVQFEHLAAGCIGGITSTLLLHPLDLLKIRFAVNDGQLRSRPQYHSLLNAFRTIKREEGFRGFYRGVVANCLSAGASWGCYFFFYHTIRNYMLDGSTDIVLGPWDHMLAAAQAGMLTLVFTNPISMVKTRMCLQYADHYMNVPTCRRYTGMLEAFQKVYRYEGVSGLYRGLVPGLFNVSHGALQFMIYEEIKGEYSLQTGRERMTTLGYLGAAAASKLLAALVTYPLQLFRARLQDQHQQYRGLREVITRTWKGEGFRGFYKGVVAYSIHVTPNICIVFIIYENLVPSSE